MSRIPKVRLVEIVQGLLAQDEDVRLSLCVDHEFCEVALNEVLNYAELELQQIQTHGLRTVDTTLRKSATETLLTLRQAKSLSLKIGGHRLDQLECAFADQQFDPRLWNDCLELALAYLTEHLE